MESLYDITKRLGKGKGEDMMWGTLRVVSDTIDSKLSKEDIEALNAKIYGMLSGGHFDEEHAVNAVAKMSYTDKDKAKHLAPYWTIPQVEEIYESVKDDIPSDYNKWDFYVAFQMIASDNWLLFHKWWPTIDSGQFAEKVAEATVNWLVDDDNPYGDKKIWCYLNGDK